MIKKTLTYPALDGSLVTEDFYFHLTKADVLELELSEKGGWEASMRKLIESEDTKTIMQVFKDIVKLAYGKRSEDGKAFIKSPELSLSFAQSDAFSELLWWMFTDASAAADFFAALRPAGMNEVASNGQQHTVTRTDGRPPLQDHLPKQSPHTQYAPVKAPESSTAVDGVESPAEELRVVTTDSVEGETPAQNDPAYAEYLAWKASQPADGAVKSDDV